MSSTVVRAPEYGAIHVLPQDMSASPDAVHASPPHDTDEYESLLKSDHVNNKGTVRIITILTMVYVVPSVLLAVFSESKQCMTWSAVSIARSVASVAILITPTTRRLLMLSCIM